jgi:hypothetical protein
MENCPLCYRWDCECEDILSKEEYERLVQEAKEEDKNFRR